MIGLIVIVAISAVLASWLWRRKNLFAQRERMGLSGPTPSFFLGNLKDFAVSEEERIHLIPKWRKVYGDCFGFFKGPVLTVVMFDLDMLKEVLIKQFHCFVDRMHFVLQDQEKVSGQGLISLRDQRWKEVRGAISPVFSSGKLKMMSKIINEKDEIFMKKMRKFADDGKAFDIYRDLQALTLDVIGRAAFAMDTNCQMDPTDPFLVKCIEFFANTDIVKSPIAKLALTFPEFSSFWSKFRFMVPFGPAENYLVGGLERVLQQRKKGYKDFKGIDILQLLLQQQAESESGSTNHDEVTHHTDDTTDDHEFMVKKKATSLSDTSILANSFVFLLAGYETTSTALAYCCWLLAKHQEVQRRLQEEVDERMVKKGSTVLSYDIMRDMPYLDAVFHESLRYFPPVTGFVTRTCIQECVINGVTFKPGVEVTAPVQAIHHDPNLWPDPEKFDPERFMGPRNYHPMAWIPFGAGPRNCIGLRFAEMEFKMSLTKLLSEFTMTLPKDADEKLYVAQSGVLMRPKKGVHVHLKKRETSV